MRVWYLQYTLSLKITYDYKGDILSHPDCIQCGKCVTACPKKSIGYGKITLK